MSYQPPMQLRTIKLDVISPDSTSEERWNMARKLALICYYLNTRCRTGAHFFNGGVTEKHYINPQDPDYYDEEDSTTYLRINDDFLLNNHSDDKNTFGLLSSNMDDNELRNCASNYVNLLRQKVPNMGFLNFAQ